MWQTTKRILASALLGAVVVSAGGCATTMAAEQRETVGVVKDNRKDAGGPEPRAKTMYGMCRILRAQGKPEQAEIALVGLMSEYPDFSPTYNDLAEIHLERGQLENAVHYLDEGLKVAPTDPVLQNNAGVCALLKRDFAKALEHFQAAAAIAPYESRYKANIALATGLNGDPERSQTLYQDVISSDNAELNAKIIKQMLAPPQDHYEHYEPTD